MLLNLMPCLECLMSPETHRCLIIDDQLDFCELVQLGIQNDFESDIACDAFTAQQLLAKKDYHIIVSDINMPIINGLDFALELKKKLINIPTIFVTGDLTPEVSKQAFQIGAANLMQKPVNLQELTEKMKLAIEIAKNSEDDTTTDHELGYIYNLLKSHYYDIQEILYQIQYYHVPISVVKDELDKKERMGKCHLDDPENIKFLATTAAS